MLYDGLRVVLLAARERGMRTTVTTNGTVLDPRRLALLEGAIDLVAVSVDGPPELHDTIRLHPGGFSRTEAGLRALAAAGIPFAIAHTLTTASLPHLAWLIGYARDMGASLVQIHPLQRTGRGAAMGPQQLRDDEALQRVFVYGTLRQLAGLEPAVHVDLLPSAVAALRLRATAERLARRERCPSLVDTLVLDVNGSVRAYSANAGDAFLLVRDGDRSLRDAWDDERWRERLAREMFAVVEALEQLDESTPVNWFDWIVTGAREDVAIGG